MTHHHERQICGGCGGIIAQCRCMEPKTDRVVCETCPNCNVVPPGGVPYPKRATKKVQVITPVSDEDLLHVRGALAFGSTAYLGAFDAVIAELRALRVVADAAVACKLSNEDWEGRALNAALRDAGRL